MGIIKTLADKITQSSAPLDLSFIDDAAEQGVCIFYFNGKSINNKADFFNTAKRVMRLPGYFGDNWDAFEECINDLSWITAEGFIFVYDNTSLFFSKHPDDAETLLSIINDARDSLEQGGVPFEFILSGNGELFKKIL